MSPTQKGERPHETGVRRTILTTRSTDTSGNLRIRTLVLHAQRLWKIQPYLFLTSSSWSLGLWPRVKPVRNGVGSNTTAVIFFEKLPGQDALRRARPPFGMEKLTVLRPDVALSRGAALLSKTPRKTAVVVESPGRSS